MTYRQITKAAHSHRFFIDANTGDKICLCGIQKGQEEKRAKYHNRPQTYNGITYHSSLESYYAAELDWRVKSKELVSWERQVKLDLRVNGEHITNYYMDFVELYPDGHRQFTECKGLEMEVWKMKWRILEATFEDFKKHPDDCLLVVKETSMRFRK